MTERKQSTATYPVLFFMADSTDHITGKTGLSPTVTIAKNGGTFAAPTTGTVTAVGNGWYSWTGAAGDWNTLGELAIHASATGADPADLKYTVVAYNPFSATDLGLSSIATILAQANKLTFDGSNNVTAILAASTRMKLDASQPDYAPAKAGNQMTLTSAYDTAKTAAQAGDKMDLVNAPNATAVNALWGVGGSNRLLTQNVYNNGEISHILHGDTYWKTSDGVSVVSFASTAASDIADIEDAIANIPAATYSGPSAADIQTQLEGTGSYLKLIKTKTDLLTFTGSDLKATLDGETVVLGATQSLYAPSKAGDAMTLTSAYDAAKTAAAPGAAMILTTAYNAAKTASQAGDAMTITAGTLTSIRGTGVDSLLTISNYSSNYYIPLLGHGDQNWTTPVGYATAINLGLVKTVTDHLATALELDSGSYRFTIAALENAPIGEGGGDYTGPTAIEIREEIDANSTQLALIIEDLGVLDGLGGISGRTTDILSGITILMSMVEQDSNNAWRFVESAIYNIGNFVISYGNQYWFTGPSSVHCLYTLTSTLDNSPIPDARVRFTSDEAGENTVVTEWTDDQGIAAFDLNAGDYWLWRDKPDWTFENPQKITIGGTP